MLVQFSVTNFRSFKETQTFSMVKTTSGGDNAAVIETGFTAAPYLWPVASLHGANASGKSNLLKAMSFFQRFVFDSAKDIQLGEPIEEAVPFLFANDTANAPCEFEIFFIHEDQLFQYGFSVDKKRVHDEWLYITNKNGTRQKPQRWFERNSADTKASYVSSHIKGAKKIWRDQTRDNALFLSTAVQQNSKELSIPFMWLRSKLVCLLSLERLDRSFTNKRMLDETLKDGIVEFVKLLDPAIENIAVSEREYSKPDWPSDMPEEFKQKFLSKMREYKAYDVMTYHKMIDGSGLKPLDISEASQGTQRWYALAAPILDVLAHGRCLVVDELDGSLHPLAHQHLVNLFNNKATNPHGAQLIFTAHDTNIMNHLDREQIWLLEKNKFGVSKLSSVGDFKGFEGEAIAKRYLAGRYGGVPLIGAE